jgi:hypothetical protein
MVFVWPCRLLSSPSGYPLQILARAEFEAGAIRKPGSGPASGFFATIPHGGSTSALWPRLCRWRTMVRGILGILNRAGGCPLTASKTSR